MPKKTKTSNMNESFPIKMMNYCGSFECETKRQELHLILMLEMDLTTIYKLK